MKTLRFFPALLLLVAGVWAAEADVKELVLPEKLFPQLEVILANAVKQSPRMLNQALNLEIAENTRIQARANLLPSLGGSASYIESQDTRADLAGRLSVTKIGYNFSLIQPVYYWGERRDYARMGEIQASITKGQYRDAYRALAQVLRSQYLQLISQKVLVKRAAFYLEHTQKQLAQEEERLAKKVISEFQISAFRLAAEQAQISDERTQYDFAVAKASFARLSGGEPLTDDAIPDTIPLATYDAGALDRLLAVYLGQRELPSTEAVVMRQQLLNESLTYSAIKTRLRPKFNFLMGVSQDQQSYTINIAQKYRVNSIFAGVTANWTLFDGFSSQAAVRIELARRRQMENDYKELNERLTQTAQTQVKQLNFSARSMSISDRALIAGENTLKTKLEEFDRGVMSEADVSQARIALYDAQLTALNGRADFLAKIGDFLGTIAEDPVLTNLPPVK